MKIDPNNICIEDEEDALRILSVLEPYESDYFDEYLEENMSHKDSEIAELFSARPGFDAAWQRIELLREEKLLRSEIADGFY